MSLSLLFWILMLLWAVYSLWGWYAPGQHWPWGNSLFLFVLFLLLGWAQFGAPIRG